MRSEPSAYPDLQVIFVEFPIHPRWRVGSETGFSAIFSLMRPASRGSVRLASSDPDHAPIIDPQYLSDPSDIQRMITGLHLARRIGTAPALATLEGKELFPGVDVQSDADCHAYLRSTVTTYFHPVGTCRIGTDPMSVVDAELRVHGIERLRVADASVMPLIPAGNTNAVVLGIAERAADLIAADRSMRPGGQPRSDDDPSTMKRR
jgi:choline dehydrogenase